MGKNAIWQFKGKKCHYKLFVLEFAYDMYVLLVKNYKLRAHQVSVRYDIYLDSNEYNATSKS